MVHWIIQVDYLNIYQFLEIHGKWNFFENSVNKDLAKINIENVRTIPFLIAILPSIVSQNLNFIITINYFLSFFLQLIVIYLITNFFRKS